MLTLLLAHALAADDAIQLQVMPGAVDFAESYAESLDPGFYYADVGAPYDCWDRVGITGFNLQVPIDTVDLELDQGQITATVSFGTIYGAGMQVYGQDGDIFDSCPNFDLLLSFVQVLDAQVVAPLELDTGFGGGMGGALAFRWAEPPTIDGTIEMDWAAVPDALESAAMPYVEAEIRQAAIDALTEELPPLLEEFLGDAAYAGDYGGLATSLVLSDASITSQAMSLYVDMDVAASATQSCEIGNPGEGPVPAGLRSNRLALDQGVGADLGVGLTEELIGQALHAAWEAGWFCFESDSIEALADKLRFFVDPDVAGLEGWATLDSPPEIVATDQGLRVTVPDVRMELTGVLDGNQVTLVRSRFDMTGTAVPGFDQSLTSMTLTLRNPQFTFHEITLKHVPTPDTVAPLIETEVEAWAADWARESLRNVVLFDALYYAWDVALLLDHSEPVEGGLELYFQLYDVNDPAVDKVPPETAIESAEVSGRAVDLVASASDDRADPLAWSWQLDGGGWSSWSDDPTMRFESLLDGDHRVEVIARDRWLNVDPTPATTTVTIDGAKKGGGGADSNCGCSSTGAVPALAWLPLLFLFRRRG